MNGRKIYIVVNRISYTTKVFTMAIVVHTIKGNKYLYEHYRVGKKVVCDYIGKVGDEIENVVSNTEKTIGEVTQQIEDMIDDNNNKNIKQGRVIGVVRWQDESPEYLYHGTTKELYENIKEEGLRVDSLSSHLSVSATKHAGNVVYLTSNRGLAGQFGDIVLKVKVPNKRLLFIDPELSKKSLKDDYSYTMYKGSINKKFVTKDSKDDNKKSLLSVFGKPVFFTGIGTKEIPYPQIGTSIGYYFDKVKNLRISLEQGNVPRYSFVLPYLTYGGSYSFKTLKVESKPGMLINEYMNELDKKLFEYLETDEFKKDMEEAMLSAWDISATINKDDIIISKEQTNKLKQEYIEILKKTVNTNILRID